MMLSRVFKCASNSGVSSMQLFQNGLSFGLFKHNVKHTRDVFKECEAGSGLNQLGVVLWRWRNDLFI